MSREQDSVFLVSGMGMLSSTDMGRDMDMGLDMTLQDALSLSGTCRSREQETAPIVSRIDMGSTMDMSKDITLETGPRVFGMSKNMGTDSGMGMDIDLDMARK